MRPLRSSALYILGLILCIAPSYMGCGDKCRRVVCVNGTCDDGICNCNTGYFREDCNTVINAGYNGTWALTEECLAGSDYYTVTIRPATGSLTGLDVIGIWERATDTLTAVVADNGLDVTISRQSIGNYEITGNGQADDNQGEITLHYEIFNVGQSQSFDQCTATLEKN